MTDPAKEKRERAGRKAMSQHEADALAVREKMARLRELRLAHEAAHPATVPGRVEVRTVAPKKGRKSGAKGPSLSEWLDAQQNQGRRG